MPCPWFLPSNSFDFGESFWTPLPTLKLDFNYGRSQMLSWFAMCWNLGRYSRSCIVLQTGLTTHIMFKNFQKSMFQYNLLKLNYTHEIKMLWRPLFLGATSFSSQYSNRYASLISFLGEYKKYQMKYSKNAFIISIKIFTQRFPRHSEERLEIYAR